LRALLEVYKNARGIGFPRKKSSTSNYHGVVEEVAQHIEKLKGFGQDTVSGLAIYIREMKK
jgi:hypothetical protein